MLLVSCVGHREVLGDEIDDEIEAVRTVFPPGTPIAGFYSYGEIGPHGDGRLSELHNQSMTIASFSRAASVVAPSMPGMNIASPSSSDPIRSGRRRPPSSASCSSSGSAP